MKKSKGIGKIIENIIFYLMLGVFCFVIISTLNAKRTGKDVTLFGYKPLYVMTESMHPTMELYSVSIVKDVNSINELNEKDIVTFHITNNDGREVKITHRIVYLNKETGLIRTKGDNNNVVDACYLGMDNIESKVVTTFNQTSWVIKCWCSGNTGKLIIGCFIAFPILLIFTIKSLLNDKRKRKELEEEEAERLRLQSENDIKENLSEDNQETVEEKTEEVIEDNNSKNN